MCVCRCTWYEHFNIISHHAVLYTVQHVASSLSLSLSLHLSVCMSAGTPQGFARACAVANFPAELSSIGITQSMRS